MDEKLKEEISEAFLAFRSIHSNPKSRADEFSSQILALIKQAGYVKQVDDQTPPNYNDTALPPFPKIVCLCGSTRFKEVTIPS